ncbi:MAG: RimK/LysX family protein [Gemmataceae bacterium]|nr:RimK/LysX family protein [Gemmataceae bacterium]MDW8264833.1 RimK/LysX family protein [Gemmataceae bacterium]
MMHRERIPKRQPSQEAPQRSVRLIGWKEYVGLPDWGISRLKAKIDTGARTSALDVVGYELRHDDARGWIALLHLLLDRRHPERLTAVEAPILRMVAVRHPNGFVEQRPLIETTMTLGPLTKRVRLTLTSRAKMRFRMILGRSALADDFVVDVSRQYLLKR